MASDDLQTLLEKNRIWAQSVKAKDSDFFTRSAVGQTPQYLWIGCSDSRVPATQILGLEPGQVFVHRNIANVVSLSDLNTLSVLQFAVDSLKVKHILVAGHYCCGGIETVVNGRRVGLVDNWLKNIDDIYQRYPQLNTLPISEREKRMSDINAITQVGHVVHSTIVQDAWQRGQEVSVHGLVYDVAHGLLHDLGVSFSQPENVDAALEKAILDLLPQS